ncbi:MAG: phosphatidylcholine synthase [Chloroflexi bacterium]|nr:phosphatidylcholine synthase [Chloroflexota bacterium]
MQRDNTPPFNLILAWLTHLFTASGAVWGLLAIRAIGQRQFVPAFWFMLAAVFVDASDGTLARRVNIKQAIPKIDGALLDNIIDYLNYAIVPAYFLLESNLVIEPLRLPLAALITLTSAYQFTQTDAKTADHFFKGFPSYWNVTVFYMFLWDLSPTMNAFTLTALNVLVFTPIKYIYPSRMKYLTHRRGLRQSMLALTVLWGAASIRLLLIYPESSPPVTAFMVSFTLLYALVSLYRTIVPLSDEAPKVQPIRLRLKRRFFPRVSE